ncbi:MSCRAMM family protein [Wenzhouxiangella marina]|uniref:Uncharacterized protein n=1 Tax=Wenzhouxiangella marina TaxID=1579979 RepID=A0A0K0XUU7_9GAMM|nr:carboxypeptidase regulatory-like domain-containing protein [Wenzhouxiangella marina]AKS41484.1 hypothetical protein WM2015_1110 [Wenzhouxiangella marina]MBB6086758.1 hypothetical protein [Wenzhouxiangella marina]
MKQLALVFALVLAPGLCAAQFDTALADLEAQRLWQETLSGSGAERGQVDDARDRVHRAAEMLMQVERGLIPLSPRAMSQLEEILAQGPDDAGLGRSGSVQGPFGTLQGTVREAGTLTPVTQGQVTAIPFGVGTFNSFSAALQPDGSYSLAVPPGQYVLQTRSHPEHVKEAWPGQTCVDANLCSPWYAGDIIEVGDGTVSTHDFELQRGVRLTGTVTDTSTAAVQNARVWLVSRNRNVRTLGSTAPDGSYSTSEALPPGEYRVFAEAPAGSGLIGELHDGQPCQLECRDLPVAFVALTDTSSPTVFDFQLGAGFGLSGQVFEADGLTPLEQALVQIQSVDGATLWTAQTDAGGAYQFDSLRATDYRIVVTHPSRLGQVYPGVDCFGSACSIEVGSTIALGAAPQVLDFDLQPGSTVSGTIRRLSDGTPVEGAFVRVFNSLQGGVSTLTDAAGNFTAQGLTEGTFFVSADPDHAITPGLQRGFLGNVNCPASRCGDFGDPISVPAVGTVSGVDIDLAIGGALSGQLVDQVSTAVLGFVFVPRLELWVASGPFAGQLADQGLSDEFGNYTLDGLMPGSYKATFGTSSHLGLIDMSFGGQPCPRGSCDQSLLPTVFVTAGTTLPGISATLPRGPVISGQVRDSLTLQAPDIVAAGRSQIISLYGASGNYAGFSPLDGEGRYRSRTGFPAGTFFVSTYGTRNLTPFGDNYVDQAYNGLDCLRLQCNLTGAGTGLTIAGSDIANVDFNLRQGGRIEGNVEDAGSLSGLPGVVVEAYDGLGQLLASAPTDVAGNYRIEGLPTGNYFLRTRNLIGYQDQLHAGASCNPFCDPVTGTPVPVTETVVTPGIDFSLVQSAALSGTVTLSGGPIANVTVEVYGAIGNLLGTTLSAADGSFEFNSLAAGEFYLRTRNPFGHADVLYVSEACVGSACQVRRGDPIVLSPGSSVSGLNLDLQPGALISGEVHDRLVPATKLSGVRVQLLDARGAVAFEATSDANGEFQFEALAAGDYHLVTRDTPGYVDQTLGGTPCPSACDGLNGSVVTITAGSTSAGNVLDLAPGASVSGNVLAGGSPAVGAIAQVYNASGVPVYQQPTNPSGNYEIDQLPDGDFFVRIGNVPGHVSQLWDDNNCSGYCDILNGDAVTIAGSVSVGSINFNLPAGGAISGQVTDGSSPLAVVEVVAYDLSGFIAGRAQTDAAGNYSIGGLENGSYRLRTTNTGGFVDQVYGGSSCSPLPCPLAGGSTVAVAGASVPGIDFALTAGGSISGSATDQFGNPLISGTARLLDENGIELDSVAISSGIWRFDGLADGSYFVLIENDLGLIDELFAGVPCPGGACDIPALGTPITLGGGRVVGRGASSGIGLALSRGASLSGRLTDAQSGSPIVGATVYVRTLDGRVAASGVTDGLGDYRTDGSLPDGQYYVSTASGTQRGVDDNYINELYPDVDCPLDCDLSLGTIVDLNGIDVGGFDFALDKGAGVAGHVRNADNQPLVQVEVLFFDGQGRAVGSARSDSLGFYRVSGLPAGDYFAHTRNVLGLADVTLGDQPCDGNCDPLDGTSVNVPASGQVTGIDFVLDVPDSIFLDRFQQ